MDILKFIKKQLFCDINDVKIKKLFVYAFLL